MSHDPAVGGVRGAAFLLQPPVYIFPRLGGKRGLVSSTGCLDPPLCEGPLVPQVLSDVPPSVRVGNLGTEAAIVRDHA